MSETASVHLHPTPTPALRVEVSPDAVLMVTADGDDVRGVSPEGVPFGNWGDDIAADEPAPSVEAVEAAVGAALGFPVQLDAADNVYADEHWTLTFLRVPVPDGPALSASIARIKEANTKVDVKRGVWEADKERAALSKKVYEAAVDDLQSVIRSETTLPPLLAGLDGAPADGDDWRSVPLSEALAGVSAGVLAKLAEAGLTTVGEMADYSAAHKELMDVPSIGRAKADAIEEALTCFWTKRGVAVRLAAPDDGKGDE
jgi:hypothetical protein